jgi:hypothetical protein
LISYPDRSSKIPGKPRPAPRSSSPPMWLRREPGRRAPSCAALAAASGRAGLCGLPRRRRLECRARCRAAAALRGDACRKGRLGPRPAPLPDALVKPACTTSPGSSLAVRCQLFAEKLPNIVGQPIKLTFMSGGAQHEPVLYVDNQPAAMPSVRRRRRGEIRRRSVAQVPPPRGDHRSQPLRLKIILQLIQGRHTLLSSEA